MPFYLDNSAPLPCSHPPSACSLPGLLQPRCPDAGGCPCSGPVEARGAGSVQLCCLLGTVLPGPGSWQGTQDALCWHIPLRIQLPSWQASAEVRELRLLKSTFKTWLCLLASGWPPPSFARFQALAQINSCLILPWKPQNHFYCNCPPLSSSS